MLVFGFQRNYFQMTRFQWVRGVHYFETALRCSQHQSQSALVSVLWNAGSELQWWPSINYTPEKLTWQWKNNRLKMYLLLRMVIFRYMVDDWHKKDTFLYKLQCGSDTGMISWTYVPISTSGDENHLSIVTSHLQVPCCSTDNSSNTPTSRALFVRLGGVVKSFAQKKTNNMNLIYLMESFTPPEKIITPEICG